MRRLSLIVVAAVWLGVGLPRIALAQPFGLELHNTLMPASGGMGGVSIARPQDLLSTFNANPATMSQFEGTQFVLGSAWADPNIRITQTQALPIANVDPFTQSSAAPGALAGNIGVVQNFNDYDLPIAVGAGLVSTSGGNLDFRSNPATNGTSAQILVLNVVTGASVQVTEKLSIGAGMSLGTGFMDAPFSGLGAMTTSYGLRGQVGASYFVRPDTTIGAYYQSKQHFEFEDAIRLSLLGNTFSRSFDVPMDLPQNIGIGVANTSLMDGNLLLAADLLFKQWDNCDLFRDVYRNQWVIQTGAQYSWGRARFRGGYVYAQNPVAPITSAVVDGIPVQDLVAGASYLQAQVAVINEHRFSIGMGLVDILPGLNLDSFAGFMAPAEQQLAGTNLGMSSYYLGAGATWRFGARSGLKTETPSY
ncbi:MAG TPA: outer membrane protein transport protein [Pirellulales bacterium]